MESSTFSFINLKVWFEFKLNHELKSIILEAPFAVFAVLNFWTFLAIGFDKSFKSSINEPFTVSILLLGFIVVSETDIAGVITFFEAFYCFGF